MRTERRPDVDMNHRHETAPPLPRLPARDPRGHKGTFGTVAVVGGCARADMTMIGGPCFAALAALRAGAGLARLALPRPIMNAGLTIAPSATGAPLPVDHESDLVPHSCAVVLDELIDEAACLAIGPGLGLGEGPRAVALRAVLQDVTPVVVDADGLNNLAEAPELHRDFHAAAILTPHPGEFRRLARLFDITDDPVEEASRPAAAEELARLLGCVVALKGARTVVTDGHQTWVNDTGDSALATAGTGDVLTGLIAGLIAQFHRPAVRPAPERTTGRSGAMAGENGRLSLFDCARLAVHAHGLAADRWRERFGASGGMLVEDLLTLIPEALESLR